MNSDVSQPAMHPLSLGARERLQELFTPEAREAAEHLLTSMPQEDRYSPAHFERIWFAALRLSGGDLTELRAAISLAAQDWRDLLVAAGFGFDVSAHLSWRPLSFSAAVAADWRAKKSIPTVQFAPGARVAIGAGRFKAQHGTLERLVGLEPEPRFLVRTDRGKETEVRQSSLRAAG